MRRPDRPLPTPSLLGKHPKTFGNLLRSTLQLLRRQPLPESSGIDQLGTNLLEVQTRPLQASEVGHGWETTSSRT